LDKCKKFGNCTQSDGGGADVPVQRAVHAVKEHLAEGTRRLNTPEGMASFAVGIGSGSLAEGPLAGTIYTPKVMKQIKQGDYHSFPKLIDQFAGDGSVTQETGGDGLSRTKIALPGSINGKDGNYTWIVEPDNTTVNHRMFELNP
jgi:hypothetical protein